MHRVHTALTAIYRSLPPSTQARDLAVGGVADPGVGLGQSVKVGVLHLRLRRVRRDGRQDAASVRQLAQLLLRPVLQTCQSYIRDGRTRPTPRI